MPVDVDDRSTNGLRDAACLGLLHAGVADGIEQGRLAVVDMAHDRDYRRARLEVGLVVVERELHLLFRRDDLDLAAEVAGDELDQVVAHRLRQRQRGAQQEQALDDLVAGNVEGLGELADRDAARDRDGADGDAERLCLLRRLLGSLLRGLGLAVLLALLAAAGRLLFRLGNGSAGLLEHLVALETLGIVCHLAVAVVLGLGVHGLDGALALFLLAGALLAIRAVVFIGRAALAGVVGMRCLLFLLGLLGLGALVREAVVFGGDLREQAVEHGGVLLHDLLLGLLLLLRLLLAVCGGALLALLLAALELLAHVGLVLFFDLLAVFLGLADLLRRGLLLFRLDLLGTLLQLGAELLADLVDVGIYQRRCVVLGGDLHLLELLEELLGGHAKLLGQFVYAHACHLFTIPTAHSCVWADLREFRFQPSVIVCAHLAAELGIEKALLGRLLEAWRLLAQVRAPAGDLARQIELDAAVGRAHDAHEGALVAAFAAGHARTCRSLVCH